jgi:diadenosine tetraphosphate (Ap4A) HIT family hydrolase
MVATWDELVDGTGCPYDGPLPDHCEYFDRVAELTVSSLCLAADQTYRGTCTLIFRGRHVTRVDQLTPLEWSHYTKDLLRAHNAIVAVTRPDHINLAALGNTIPHLHWGIIPRYRSDPRWRQPIWTTSRSEVPVVRLSARARSQLIDDLKGELSHV